MAAHRPIAHRAFTLLFAFLLVGSLVAPIAASPAAAQDSTTEQVCDSPARFFEIVNKPCTTAEQLGTVDETESGAYLQSDVHANARGVEESWESTYILTGNYLEDTPTIASLEGKEAIANSWENNATKATATENVNESIDDYYTNLEIQLLEEYSAHSAQLAYLSNQTHRDSETPDEFIHTTGWDDVDAGDYDRSELLTETANLTYNLSDGSVHEYQGMQVKMYFTNSNDEEFDRVYDYDMESYDETGEEWTYGTEATNDGVVVVQNVPEFDLLSEQVYDNREVAERLIEIENQRQTAHDNFDPQFIDSMYTALDNGEITPEDLRGAEGMVRYLSGDAEVTDQRYKLATHAVLELDRPDLNMSMVVSYDGATDYETEDENGTRVRNYTGHVNETYEGLLFSGETPTDGFETGQTYDTDALNGSQLIVTQNETVHFYDGNFTIEEMYDSDGNEVTNQTWERPNYETYDSDEYVALLEQIAEDQKEIEENEDSSGGDGITIGDLFGSNPAIGLTAVLVVVVLFLLGKITP
ncbi:hypothetical protein ACFO5R_08780 [Halosolutus amylolyticus]|uniref:Envelope protein N-terminal domain-containing protein n=1 Tax=Halosolutus amylolyticus TaxID=2932267 RepID=A0ABD5PNU8_9EURY|nr:hypothetical protein [Halosolutus amylolyticus]